MVDPEKDYLRKRLKESQKEIRQASSVIERMSTEKHTLKERIEELEKKVKLLQAARDELLNRIRYLRT